jgi:hypothetical protein
VIFLARAAYLVIHQPLSRFCCAIPCHLRKQAREIGLFAADGGVDLRRIGVLLACISLDVHLAAISRSMQMAA